MTADVEKTLLQIMLSEKDCDAVRFLWPANPMDENSQIKEYRWKRVVFGLTCSPFLLAATIKHHAEKFKWLFPEEVRILNSELNVDDVISGADCPIEARSIAVNLSKILEEAKLPLRRWVSNDKWLQQEFHLTSEPKNEAVELCGADSKVLGLV